MRIKTSKATLDELDELKKFLNFETNAQVLKLAISVALNNEQIEYIVVKEDGFEIALNVLFGVEQGYFEQLIMHYYKRDELVRQDILNLIESGIQELVFRKNYAKQDLNTFLKSLLEEKCI